MRYLVTGGAGFIGSNIVERLLKEGHFVRVLDNFSTGKKENLNFTVDRGPWTMDFELIEGDIRDFATCQKACKEIDFVLHQAALRSVPKSLEIPYEFNEVNINGTLNLLKASLEAKVKRFVLASSSSVYGDRDEFPEREEDYPRLISPYALTKLAGEYYCRVFSQNYGLETVSLRYFNVFGPRQALDDEYAVVIPKFINCMLNNQNPPVHGSGKQSRDFTYIDNVVEANILAAITSFDHRPSTMDHGLVFNVACGQDQSILDLVDALNKIMNKSIQPVFTPPRPGDVFRTLADISKINKMLGYKAKVGFESGLRKTIEWFQLVHGPCLAGRQAQSTTHRLSNIGAKTG